MHCFRNVSLYGIIPGGKSFVIPTTNITNSSSQSSINWTPDVSPGTELIVVGGDDLGFGSGGSFNFTVGSGNSTSCISSGVSPSSTLGSPAGGSYPTDINGDLTTPSTSVTVSGTTSATAASSTASNGSSRAHSGFSSAYCELISQISWTRC